MDVAWHSDRYVHKIRMDDDEFLKRIHMGSIEGVSVRGTTPVKWIIRVDEEGERW